MGKLVYTLADYQNAARTYRSQLLRLPLLGLNATAKYMTIRPGIRHSEVVGAISTDVEFAPYKKGVRKDLDLNLDHRILSTYFGQVNADFDPNEAISTLLGHRASQAMGEKLKTTPQAHEVLASIAKSVSYHLNNAVWDAVRDANGTTTKDLFDGFDTITSKEITAGNLAESKGNYMKLAKAVTSENAVSIAKEILYNLDDHLRGEQAFMFTTQDFADKYNEAYLLGHTGLVYNKQFNQVAVEGSNGQLIIVPLASKRGSKFIHVSVKRNMLLGCDQMGDTERVDVKEYAPDTLTFMMRMFFGTQFESIDARRLMVAELAGESEAG